MLRGDGRGREKLASGGAKADTTWSFGMAVVSVIIGGGSGGSWSKLSGGGRRWLEMLV